MKYKNLYTKTRLTTYCITFILWIFSFSTISAASMYFNPAKVDINEGGKGTITVYVDTEGKSAYSVEAVIDVIGDAVEFNSVSATGDTSSSDLDSSIDDTKITFRVLKDINETIEGIQPIVAISYEAVNSGETTLEFITDGNFEVSLIAEDETGDNILTSTSNAIFVIQASENNDGDEDIAYDPPNGTCGDGVVNNNEQCDYTVSNSCNAGYICNTACVCVTSWGSGNQSTITPTQYGNQGGNITPPTLPNSSWEQNEKLLILYSLGLLIIGFSTYIVINNTSLISLGNELKISLKLHKIARENKQNKSFEKSLDK